MKSNREPLRPSAESVRLVTAASKDIAPDDARLVEWHDTYVAHHTARIALDLDLVRSTAPKGASVLEFGSVPLLLTAALSRLGYEVSGSDIEPERYSTAIARLGLRVARCDVERERLPFDDSSFDVVIFNELFEHLRINPIFTMSEALRVMKPDGRLLMSTPNLRSLAGIVNFLLRNKAHSCSGNIYAQYEKLEKLGHMGHVREYTTREVIDFLKQVGFGIEGIVWRGKFGFDLVDQIVLRMLPAMSPFVSYIVKKPPAIAA